MGVTSVHFHIVVPEKEAEKSSEFDEENILAKTGTSRSFKVNHFGVIGKPITS